MLAHRVEAAASNRLRPSVPKLDLEQSKRWMMFLMHARACSAPKGTCRVVQSGVRCVEAQELNLHIHGCWSMNCGFHRCSSSKKLVKHVCTCVKEACPLCVPVRDYFKSLQRQGDANAADANPAERVNPHGSAHGSIGHPIKRVSSSIEASDHVHPKRRNSVHTQGDASRTSTNAADANPSKPVKPHGIGNADGSIGHPIKRVSSAIEASDHVRPAKRLNSVHTQGDASRTSTNVADANPAKPVKPMPHGNANGSIGRPIKRVSSVIQASDHVRPAKRLKSVPQLDVDSHRNAHFDGSKSRLMKTPLVVCGASKDMEPAKQVVFNHTYSDKRASVHETNNTSYHAAGYLKRALVVCESSEDLKGSKRMKVQKSTVGTSINYLMEPGQGNPHVSDNTTVVTEPHLAHDVVHIVKEETAVSETENGRGKLEKETEVVTKHIAGTKSGMPKREAVSMTEVFTVEQIREHIQSLREWSTQRKAKDENDRAIKQSISEKACQLCSMKELNFKSLPIYCTTCRDRVKLHETYYTMGSGESACYICRQCYNEAPGDTTKENDSAFPKTGLKEKKADKEILEPWVQCCKCQAWQHQICALYNARKDDAGNSKYTCPKCYVKEIEKAERKPLPQSAILGAKDLPTTILSDHLEERLFRRLNQERLARAKHLGKSFDEVARAEELVVRVVSSIDKRSEVKQLFAEIFKEWTYPTEFPYRSKAILLFQKIEGVDVCLFGIYVQEYGSECQFPNQRQTYISYLDSVKYFRPNIETVTGEALRTFVYHEILIGYLDYCKKKGFGSCSMWACPPLEGDDYILYCHPHVQKTPNSGKLSDWYIAMLQKATKERIVVGVTNLYDHFFAPLGECKAKITAARLPYFDGDYWPGLAEDLINQLHKEDNCREQQKGGLKKALTERLGKDLYLQRKDHIVVHLQHACTHCSSPMISGTRWLCPKCTNFHLCEKCHVAEERLGERDKHPKNSRKKHVLYPVEICGVPSYTEDKDQILKSEFFDTRESFLSLCQGNHYQFDTLRNAKYSSMMILYHLHNPTAPAFVATCNVCEEEVISGKGWRCETCPDFDMCDDCHETVGANHPHPLRNI